MQIEEIIDGLKNNTLTELHFDELITALRIFINKPTSETYFRGKKLDAYTSYDYIAMLLSANTSLISIVATWNSYSTKFDEINYDDRLGEGRIRGLIVLVEACTSRNKFILELRNNKKWYEDEASINQLLTRIEAGGYWHSKYSRSETHDHHYGLVQIPAAILNRLVAEALMPLMLEGFLSQSTVLRKILTERKNELIKYRDESLGEVSINFLYLLCIIACGQMGNIDYSPLICWLAHDVGASREILQSDDKTYSTPRKSLLENDDLLMGRLSEDGNLWLPSIGIRSYILSPEECRLDICLFYQEGILASLALGIRSMPTFTIDSMNTNERVDCVPWVINQIGQIVPHMKHYKDKSKYHVLSEACFEKLVKLSLLLKESLSKKAHSDLLPIKPTPLPLPENECLKLVSDLHTAFRAALHHLETGKRIVVDEKAEIRFASTVAATAQTAAFFGRG